MRLTIVLALQLLAAESAAGAERTASITPFDLLADGSVVVPVMIGGTGPFRFVIDTGSSRTVVSTRVSQALRLTVIAASPMVTPSGRDLAYIVRIANFAIDLRPPVNLAAAIMPFDRYAAGQRVDGLIGQDLLANETYTIDYDQRAIFWDAAGADDGGVRLPLNIRDNRVLVTLPQSDRDPSPLAMVPDTGSDGLVVFAHAQDKLRFRAIDVGVLSGISGSRLVRRVEIDGLMIGSTRLSNSLAVIVDSAEPRELMGDGLLPLHQFSRVTFNVADGYLIVRP